MIWPVERVSFFGSALGLADAVRLSNAAVSVVLALEDLTVVVEDLVSSVVVLSSRLVSEVLVVSATDDDTGMVVAVEEGMVEEGLDSSTSVLGEGRFREEEEEGVCPVEEDGAGPEDETVEGVGGGAVLVCSSVCVSVPVDALGGTLLVLAALSSVLEGVGSLAGGSLAPPVEDDGGGGPSLSMSDWDSSPRPSRASSIGLVAAMTPSAVSLQAVARC